MDLVSDHDRKRSTGGLGRAYHCGCEGARFVVRFLLLTHDHPRDLRVDGLVGRKGGWGTGDSRGWVLRWGMRQEESDGTSRGLIHLRGQIGSRGGPNTGYFSEGVHL